MSTVKIDIEQLQMKMAFQEDTIESLNQALILQQKQIDDLQFHLKQLVSKMSAIEPSNMASEKEELPPPHYWFRHKNILSKNWGIEALPSLTKLNQKTG